MKENTPKIVAIKDMSAGNESVGEMWKETKIFDPDQPISDIIKWVQENLNYPYKDGDKSYLSNMRKNVVITVCDSK